WNFTGNFIPDGVTAQTVIDDYINAIGTSTKLMGVKKLHQRMEVSAQGMSLVTDVYRQSPDKFAAVIKMGPTVIQKETYDGTVGKVSGMQENKTLEGEELESFKERATIFPELTYDQKGFKMELKGIEEINGQNAYKMLIESPSGEKVTEYFAVESSLKIRSVSGEGETVDFSEYKAVDGIMFPYSMSTTMPGAPMKMEMKVEAVEVNGDFDETVFQ
ncbi:MAG: hypothetical protein AAF985_23555, partial [Bacteroidota bacterium]